MKKVKSVVFRYEVKTFRCEVDFLFCSPSDLTGELKKLYKELRQYPEFVSVADKDPTVGGVTFRLACFPYKIFVYLNTKYPIQIGLVAHECLHAVHYIMSICNIPVSRVKDEIEAYLLTELVDEVFTHVTPIK